MSSCLSRGGRPYGLELEIIKSTSSTSSRSCQSSPSSSNGNSPLAISTRKPRTPRKRPNQTYNEAAALLSTAYPYLFSAKNFTKPPKFTKPHRHSLFHDSSDLLLFPFRVIHDSGFLLHNQPKPVESKVENVCNKCDTSSGEVNSHGGGGSMEREVEFQDDIDAESILEEESEGIDSIMGKLSVKQETCGNEMIRHNSTSWYMNAVGLRKGVGALRHLEQQANWWNFSTVDLQQISPKTNTGTTGGRAEKKKKKNKAAAAAVGNPSAGLKLKLKLNYEEVVNAWSESDGGSPFSQEPPGNDVYMDLLSEAEGGVREASVLRYKQKRHTRLFSTKIRYQVRKLNADRRPRIKGRFVRRPNSCTTSEER
ncbi:chloroplast import apparatus 2 [Hibiscus trionum]|uniref:Chloroplast import apparatus 2 n=1 Tax=Hibiscus trionum TaxID=183268 RepID=A0A9W7ID61_HIBTR|nr:chloroplast import apparatus 2 [Hibiscus trionum]